MPPNRIAVKGVLIEAGMMRLVSHAFLVKHDGLISHRFIVVMSLLYVIIQYSTRLQFLGILHVWTVVQSMLP